MFKKVFKWVQDNLLLTIVILPFFVIFILHVVNFLSKAININMNPISIGNTEWFLFCGSYIAGICTLISVRKTLIHNNETLNKTIDYNKKSSDYERELVNIEREINTLSEIISKFQFRYLHDVVVRYQDASMVNSSINDKEVLNILKSIQEYRHAVDIDKTRIQFETTIYNGDCSKCINIKKCNLGKTKNPLANKYGDVYIKYCNALNEAYQYILVSSVNMNLKIQIIAEESQLEQRKNEIANPASTHPETIKKLEELIHTLEYGIQLKQSRINEDKQELHIKNIIKITKKVSEDDEITQLISLVKQYQNERKLHAKKVLHGEDVLSFISCEDNELKNNNDNGTK